MVAAPDPAAPAAPDLVGKLNLDLEADLQAAPPLADAAAWLAAWEDGLAGRVEVRATGSELSISLPTLPDPLTVGSR